MEGVVLTMVAVRWSGNSNRYCIRFPVLVIYLSFFLSTFGFADQWLCKEAASIRQGDSVLACGIGTASNEAEARIEALKQAKREFEEICSASVDCQGHTLTLVPLRNDCEQKGNSFKCYRGLQFEIGSTLDAKSYLEQQKAFLDEEIALTESKLSQMQEVRNRKRKLEQLRKKVEADEDDKPEVVRGADPTSLGFTLLAGTSSLKDDGQISYGIGATLLAPLSPSLRFEVEISYRRNETLDLGEWYHDRETLGLRVGMPIYILSQEGLSFSPELVYSIMSIKSTYFTDRGGVPDNTFKLSQIGFGGSLAWFAWIPWNTKANYGFSARLGLHRFGKGKEPFVYTDGATAVTGAVGFHFGL